MRGSACLSSLKMGGNKVCTLKVGRKHGLLTFFPRGQKQNATKPLTSHIKLLTTFPNQF